jgi:hypothetical protein
LSLIVTRVLPCLSAHSNAAGGIHFFGDILVVLDAAAPEVDSLGVFPKDDEIDVSF